MRWSAFSEKPAGYFWVERTRLEPLSILWAQVPTLRPRVLPNKACQCVQRQIFAAPGHFTQMRKKCWRLGKDPRSIATDVTAKSRYRVFPMLANYPSWRAITAVKDGTGTGRREPAVNNGEESRTCAGLPARRRAKFAGPDSQSALYRCLKRHLYRNALARTGFAALQINSQSPAISHSSKCSATRFIIYNSYKTIKLAWSAEKSRWGACVPCQVWWHWHPEKTKACWNASCRL